MLLVIAIQALIADLLVEAMMPWPDPAATYRFWGIVFVITAWDFWMVHLHRKEQAE